VSAPDNAMPEATPPSASGHDEILRFRISERQMHWAIAVPFMICYGTAVVLSTVYNAHPDRPYREVLSWTHRASGVALLILPLWTIVQHWYDFSIHRYNIRDVWRWTLADVKWLFLIGPSTLNKKVALPEQGKFNAAEKINFMVLMATLPVYFLTGVMIWFHQFAFLAWVVHLSMAAVATTLMGGHIFMATVNPDTRVGLSGMITGFVDRHWASHHYGRWYKENFADIGVVDATGLEAAWSESGEVLAAGSTPEGADTSDPDASRATGPDEGEDPPWPPFYVFESVECAHCAYSRRLAGAGNRPGSPPMSASFCPRVQRLIWASRFWAAERDSWASE